LDQQNGVSLKILQFCEKQIAKTPATDSVSRC